MGPDSLFVKAILLFKIDKESLSVLLNRVMPLNNHLSSICVPICEEIQVIFCPSIVSIVPFPFPISISFGIWAFIYVLLLFTFFIHFSHKFLIYSFSVLSLVIV